MALAARYLREVIAPVRWLYTKGYAESRVLSSLGGEATQPPAEGAVVAKDSRERHRTVDPAAPEFRHMYPEFLPDPKPTWRNTLREKLERADMMRRRNVIDIPEFYVGSILAVTISDPHAQGKTNRFVGICIDRLGAGLRAEFILRNVINHQGIEVRYEQYDPAIQKIQVLRLERRLDDKLLYLRDALPEYYTYDQDMEPEVLAEGAPVPLNTTQVKLKPRPWLERWERQELRGVSNIERQLKYRQRATRDARATPWEKYDLMKTYRRSIPEEEQSEIWAEVSARLHALQLARKKMSRKRSFTLPPSRLDS